MEVGHGGGEARPASRAHTPDPLVDGRTDDIAHRIGVASPPMTGYAQTNLELYAQARAEGYDEASASSPCSFW
jgi:hypothetical protein